MKTTLPKEILTPNEQWQKYLDGLLAAAKEEGNFPKDRTPEKERRDMAMFYLIQLAVQSAFWANLDVFIMLDTVTEFIEDVQAQLDEEAQS